MATCDNYYTKLKHKRKLIDSKNKQTRGPEGDDKCIQIPYA